MKPYHTRHGAGLSTRGFYTILGICGIIIAASAWVLWSNTAGKREQKIAIERQMVDVQTPVPSSTRPVDAMPDLQKPEPAAAPEAEAPAAPVQAEQQTPAAQHEKTEAAAQNETEQPAPVAAPTPAIVRPVAGGVLSPYTGDTLVFQPTLGDWRVHTGTDFAAAEGERVLALTDGTVQQVYEDALFGKCVRIAHDGSLVTAYCGLGESAVSEGQVLAAGEVVGSCAGIIPAEAEMEPHIHVEARRADTLIDVLELLGENMPE